MSDKLVFDLAQEVEGSPNVFIRKDWINILDNQNQNYNNNQSVIDTSQLSNSNKYMSYREAYLSMPLLITLAQTSLTVATANATRSFNPNTAGTSADHCIGLKNWFGQIIHSFTLDYNGTTIIQQTPYINMWNSFKLMTSLSLDDINTQGATIGFYPDDPLAWSFNPATVGAPNNYGVSVLGQGVSNNSNYVYSSSIVNGQDNNFRVNRGNEGFLKRQQLINFDGAGFAGTVNYSSMLNNSAITNCWKSYISNKVNYSGLYASGVTYNTPNQLGVIQYSVVATIYLKHIHSFFNMCPLLKGVFMKMTMNLNNTTCDIVTQTTQITADHMYCSGVSNPLGGVNPLLIAGGSAANDGVANGGRSLFGAGNATSVITNNFSANVSVGATCLNNTIRSANTNVQLGNLSKSIYLYVPAYTFNPVFEQAYLSSPVKAIKYTDVYQYQIINVNSGGTFTNLLTNGIANVKSILVLPFYSSSGNTLNNGFLDGTQVFQSPFDPAGTGPTSPMCWLTNFNVQVSGQNAIYNVERYNFEQFNNQLYGQNAVNGGLTDGITSGLINRQAFDMEYCYYYVNIERMLPVEQSVPKSIQVLGQNMSSRALDLWCFIEYGNEVSIDILTGSRV
jgi:hypothetical protein